MNMTRSRVVSRGATRIEVESPSKRLSKNGRDRASRLNLAKPFTSRAQRPRTFDPEADYDFDSTDEEDDVKKATPNEDEVLCKSVIRGRAIYQRLCQKYGKVPIQNVLKQIGRNAISLAGYNLSRREMRAFFVALIEAYVNDDEEIIEGKSRDLKYLELGGNVLGVKEIDYITDFANAYSPLVHVLLNNCRLCSRGLQNLTVFLKTNKTLKLLDLSGNRFTDNDGQYIAEIIDSSDYITELLVSKNELRESGVLIGQALANNIALKHLDLSWNHLRGNGAIGICKGITKNRCLESINLGWNGFSYEGSSAMGVALKENTTLQNLDLSHNRIYPQAVFELIKGLDKNKTLTTLKLGGNPITANMTSVLLSKVLQWKESNLKELDLEGIVVDKDFNEILKQIQENRIFIVRYDTALPLSKGHVSQIDPKNIFNIDPVRILYFMKEHLRTIDLFLKVDKDSNKFLSRDEMKYAFEMEGFAISDSALDSVMGYLDTNKDGEVDLLLLRTKLSGEIEFVTGCLSSKTLREFINGERRLKRQLIKEHEEDLITERENDKQFSQTYTSSPDKSPRKLPPLNKPKMA